MVNGQEYLEAPAVASTPEPLPVILRARATTNTGPASRFQAKKPDEFVLVTGALSLGEKDTEHDGIPIINMTSICDANKDQFINEAMFDIKMGLGNVHFYYSFWYEIILNK